MSLFNVTDTTRCRNCGAEFAEHNYVTDSLDVYDCPHPQTEPAYGFFCGGDPRKFHPDRECCSPEEIAAWKAACTEAERLNSARNLPCPSGWIRTPEFTAHILRAPFGIGTYVMEIQTQFEAVEYDDPDQKRFAFEGEDDE